MDQICGALGSAHVARVCSYALAAGRPVQRRVAVNARLPCGAPGAFDEEEVHADLSDFILREGVGSEEVVEQVLAFTLALARARAAMQPAEPHTVAPCPNTDQQYV